MIAVRQAISLLDPTRIDSFFVLSMLNIDITPAVTPYLSPK